MMMQQAQKMQKEVQKKIDEFEKKHFEYDYKNGSVVVTISGAGLVSDISINDVLVDVDDKITLQEMIVEAVNAAIDGVKEDRSAIEQAAMPRGGL